MTVAVVVVAAGRGLRLGLGTPKAFVEISGKSLLAHCLERISKFTHDELIIVVPEGHQEATSQALAAANLSAKITVGGETRQQSVAAGLLLVGSEYVLVHDAARAFAPERLFEAVLGALESGAAAVAPVLPVADTIKRIEGAIVLETVDRSQLAAAQTPQGFAAASLRSALAGAGQEFTDDTALMQWAGHAVHSVPGHELAFKVTTPADLTRAEQALGLPRTGIGVDSHAFADSGTLTLGCLSWPGHPALDGHSDGDSVAHAIVDALLTAAGLGDIGSNFGVDRTEFAGASGQVFIDQTLKILLEAGYAPANVSIQIVADRPKIGPRRAELEARLTQLVGAPVSIAATTTDGLGFLADSRGVGAVASALIRPRG